MREQESAAAGKEMHMDRKNRIYIVGMGPGNVRQMTAEAMDALKASDVIVGYTTYIALLREMLPGKNYRATPMRQEIERCRLAFQLAAEGNVVSIVSSGDSGVYGMAAPMFALLPEYPETELAVIPGITAALSGAALLGAPINHDFAVISLSDLLTPWEIIEKRLRAAVAGDFAVVLYNPASHKRKDYLQRACDILLSAGALPGRACGYVENIGREGTRKTVCTLEALRTAEVNMFTTVFIGNSQSYLRDGYLITERGYRIS